MSKQTISKCSFCGRPRTETEIMIEGESVFICNYCVEQCNDIIMEQRKQQSKGPAVSTKEDFDYKPDEIKGFLDQ